MTKLSAHAGSSLLELSGPDGASTVRKLSQEQLPEDSGRGGGEPAVFVMPATPGQLRFWSLDQLNPGNPALNMPLMWQCMGHLDLSALRKAFSGCAERHEVLRTTFEWIDGELAQIIHPERRMPIPVADLTGLAGEAQRVEADLLTRAHAGFRMDLKNGPLLLLKLLKFSENDHLLLVNMHHIICDGISNGILMRDAVALYTAVVSGTEAQLPALPIQFADYAVWHEQWRAGAEPGKSLAFWQETLGNDFSPLRLQHDRDAAEALPPPHADVTGEIETLLIPRDLAAAARSFCVREDVTFNILLFSVFNALLSRLTEQKDLTIGSPCANRTEETEELIGLFMNIQVLRVRLEENSTFRDLLRQVQRWAIGAYENQTLPFEELIHDPFFSETGSSFEMPVFFLYQKSFMVRGRIASREGDLEIVPLRSESPGAIFDFMFAIVDREEEGPRLQLEYNPQQFKAGTIQRILHLYVDLLESALGTPNGRVDELGGESMRASAGSLALRNPQRANAVPAADADGGTGKLQVAGNVEEEFLEPRDTVEQQIAEIWQNTLGIERISLRDSFFSLGVSSLAALRLITRMNRVYGTQLGLASLISASTIEAIADLVRRRFSPNTASSLVPIQPAGSALPLFIVHGVGGNVVNFFGLSMRMGTDQPVYGIQAQSLLADQPALLRLEDMAAEYVTEIRRVQRHGPYHLLGYSFGGTVALEMAHQLRSAGEAVGMLGMLDAKAKEYEAERANRISLDTKIQHRLDRFRGNTGGLSLQSRMKYIWEKIRTRAIRFSCMAAGRLHLRTVPAFMKSAYDINFAAIKNYKPRPYDGKLILFRANEQNDRYGQQDQGSARELGWGPIFRGGVEIQDLPGDHDRMFLEPNIDALASSIRACLPAVERA